jgi:hypothetical protein
VIIEAGDLESLVRIMANRDEETYKDQILDALRRRCNVVQFVSYDPSLQQRYSLIRGVEPNHEFTSVAEGVDQLLRRSPEASINVRSYHPASPQGREFVYGLRSVDATLLVLRRLADQGLHTIINETVDINDGGVSGVIHGDMLEFAPGDTPRCVERDGTTRVSRAFGMELLELIYGFKPQIPFDERLRVEFSIHPILRGVRNEHTVIWEVEAVDPPLNAGLPHWPTRFSQLIGDKAFGLLVAHLLGFQVPRTMVFPRGLPPFRFGQPTGTVEPWIRTCPREQVPGKYTTRRGWVDPFALLVEEDPSGKVIASILAQEGVAAEYSGALLTLESGDPVIEGVRGQGDNFMQGEAAPEEIPFEVFRQVNLVFERAWARLGAVRFEWVWDGRLVWLVQLHRERAGASVNEIYRGHASSYRRFEAVRGLEALRDEVSRAQAESSGIVLVGDVGLSSHLCDVLRKARVPSRLEVGADQP